MSCVRIRVPLRTRNWPVYTTFISCPDSYSVRHILFTIYVKRLNKIFTNSGLKLTSRRRRAEYKLKYCYCYRMIPHKASHTLRPLLTYCVSSSEFQPFPIQSLRPVLSTRVSAASTVCTSVDILKTYYILLTYITYHFYFCFYYYFCSSLYCFLVLPCKWLSCWLKHDNK
jgi:hypothetical protein